MNEISSAKVTNFLLKENSLLLKNAIEIPAKGSHLETIQPVNFAKPPSARAVFVNPTHKNIALAPKFSIRWVRVTRKNDTRTSSGKSKNPRWRCARQFCAVFSPLQVKKEQGFFGGCLDECARACCITDFLFVFEFVGCWFDVLKNLF